MYGVHTHTHTHIYIYTHTHMYEVRHKSNRTGVTIFFSNLKYKLQVFPFRTIPLKSNILPILLRHVSMHYWTDYPGVVHSSIFTALLMLPCSEMCPLDETFESDFFQIWGIKSGSRRFLSPG